jgi:DNA-directed RNA polymerase subunit beta'
MEMLKKKDEKIMEVNGFEEDGTPKDFNSIYTMAISAARGGVSQIKQLAGMRGLMAKPSGEIIETPVLSNFREGLSMLEYFVSTHGARKGLADTALKTANAGYLTRKLVDVAHHEIVVEEDCGTVDGIRLEPLIEAGKTLERISDRIVGRISLEDIKDPFSDTEEYIVRAGEVIDEEKAKRIEEAGIKSVLVRSVLACNSRDGICAKCYGWDLSRRKIVDIGEAVGVIAAQSIGEPGTQLTMRTFHIGGAATVSEVSQYEAKTQGFVKYENIQYIYNRHGERVVVNRSGEIKVVDERGKEKESYPVKHGAIVKVEDGQGVRPGDILVVWDPYTESIISEHDGKVKFGDLIEGVTIKEERDEITGLIRKIVVEPKGVRGEKLQPRISIKAAYRRSNIGGVVHFDNVDTAVRNEKVFVVNDNARIVVKGEDREEVYSIPKGAWLRVGEKQYVEKDTILAYWVPTEEDTDVITIGRYPLPVGAYIQIKEGDIIYAGDILAKTPREMAKTKDITGGLPKVVQLFEARKPKDKAIIAEIDGFVELGQIMRGRRRVIIKGEGETKEYYIPTTQHILVKTGDYVRAGDKLVDGDVDPHDYLETFGVKKTQIFLLDEIQKIYRSQGVEIHDKHIEVIIRQMFKRVRIEDPGDTKFLPGDEVDKFEFEEENRRVEEEGGKPAVAKPILVGIAKIAVQSDSWISAASFQETTRVLADAVVKGKVDKLKGLKENVIVGRLIPAGTGVRCYRDTEIRVNVDTGGGEKKKESIDN